MSNENTIDPPVPTGPAGQATLDAFHKVEKAALALRRATEREGTTLKEIDGLLDEQAAAVLAAYQTSNIYKNEVTRRRELALPVVELLALRSSAERSARDRREAGKWFHSSGGQLAIRKFLAAGKAAARKALAASLATETSS